MLGESPSDWKATGRHHGTRAAYLARCRCQDCKQANAAYVNAYRKRARAQAVAASADRDPPPGPRRLGLLDQAAARRPPNRVGAHLAISLPPPGHADDRSSEPRQGCRT